MCVSPQGLVYLFIYMGDLKLLFWYLSCTSVLGYTSLTGFEEY